MCPHSLFNRYALTGVLLAALLPMAHAQELILAVNEGVTYQGRPLGERYQPLLTLLEAELKRPVRVQSVDKYAEFERGLAADKYAMAFIHPAHVSLQAVKSGKYAGVASAKGFTDYRARILVSKDSPLQDIKDLKDQKVGVPSLESITTTLFVASLRQLGMNQPEKHFTATRYQDAVPFMVEKGFVAAGVTGSERVAKDWQAKGGRILGETAPVPIKQFLVTRSLSEAQRARVQALLLKLEQSADGKKALDKIGLKGFVAWNAETMDAATAKLGL